MITSQQNLIKLFIFTTAMLFILQTPVFAEGPDVQQKPTVETSETSKTDGIKKPVIPTESEKKQNEGIIDLIVKGGWTMLGLALISTIILAFSIERFIYFKRRNVTTKGFNEALGLTIAKGGFTAVKKDLESNTSLLASIMKYGLDHQKLGAEGMELAIGRKATVEIGKLERGLNLLANFGNIAPLLGFFGTVIGMRASFLQFVIEKAPTAQDLAAGIEEALITTAAGLLVAIPTYLIYNLFIYQIDSLSTEVEEAAGQLRDAFPTTKAHKKEV